MVSKYYKRIQTKSKNLRKVQIKLYLNKLKFISTDHTFGI